MAKIFDLASSVDWADLAEGEVRIIPLLQYENGVRVRMLVTRRGEWPKHVEEEAELYVVLKGEVVQITEGDHPVRAGEAILRLGSRMGPAWKMGQSRSTWISHDQSNESARRPVIATV